MSYDFAAGGSHIGGGLTTQLGVPLTLAAFVKYTTHPQSFDGIVNLANLGSDASPGARIWTRSVDDDFTARADSASSNSQAVYVGTAAQWDGVWVGVIATFVSTTERSIYVDIISQTGTIGTSMDIGTALDHAEIGRIVDGSTNDWIHNIAEVAIWDIELADADKTLFMDGTAASGIQASALRGYWPLDTDRDTEGTALNEGADATGTLTITNAVFDADHPTISAGANPKGPFGHPIVGAFGGPI